MIKKVSLTFLLILVASVAIAFAQADEQRNPYREGESLTFEGKYKRFGFAFSIAEIKFTVSKLPQTENYQIRTRARSKGTLSSLFNFKFFQQYESRVAGENFQILKTVKHDEQGNRVRNSEATFDYKKEKVTYVENDPKDLTRPPRRVASTIEAGMQDIVSSIYLLRGKDLAVGKSFIVKVSDSGLVYDIPVKITARERRKSILGKKWCWRVEPDVFGEGRIVEQKGSLTIWFTDDELKIPIRANLKTKLGDVRIRLKKMQTKTIDVKGNGKDEDDDDKDE